MAEIVQTLFGVSPESYQQQQSALADQRALQYAKLDPFQQANYAIGRGAYGLAGAIGGALGGQDPELQRISQRQQIASQINPNDPASIERGIVALSQGGDPEGAFMLQAEYRKMQESGALIGQRQAAGQASLAQAGRERVQAIPNDIQLAREIADLQERVSQLTDLPASPERDKALRLASGQLSQLERLTAKGDKTSSFGADREATSMATFGKPFSQLDQTQQASVNQAVAKVTAPPSVGTDANRISLELYDKSYGDLTQSQRAIVNKRVDSEAAAKAPRMQVNLSDPTATAKASLDVMNKWEQVIKSDVEVAARFKALTSSVALAQAGNPSADGATIFNIGKIYDPSGAVQEGDKNTILGNPSIPQRIQLLAQTVFKGGSLTPDQRADLLKIGNELVKNKENQLKRSQKQYIKKNIALGGAEEDILNPYEGVVIPEIPSGASLIPSDSTVTKSKVGPAIPAAPIPAAPMAPAKQVRKPSGAPGAVNWKDL